MSCHPPPQTAPGMSARGTQTPRRTSDFNLPHPESTSRSVAICGNRMQSRTSYPFLLTRNTAEIEKANLRTASGVSVPNTSGVYKRGPGL